MKGTNIVTEQPTLIDHAEKYLGRIQTGWDHHPDESEKWPFQVMQCEGGVLAGTVAYCSIGLSKYPLTSATTGKRIRHELLILVRESFDVRNAPGILEQLSSSALEGGNPYLRGEIIERSNPIFKGKELYAFFAAPPFVLPEEFAVYERGEDLIVFVWMVPIRREEAAFVRSKGWRKFEKFLEAAGKDLLNLDRQSLV